MPGFTANEQKQFLGLDKRQRKTILNRADGILLNDSELSVIQRFQENVVGRLSPEHAETLPKLGLVRLVKGGYLITPRGLAVRMALSGKKARGGVRRPAKTLIEAS